MAGGTDRLGDAFERVAQRPQVHVPVDATELLAGLDHPGGAPAQRHLPIAPALHVRAVRTTYADHALDRVRNQYERPRRHRFRRSPGSWWAGLGRLTVRPSGTGALGVKQGGGRCRSVGREPVFVVGRPCDLPGCAVRADPLVSFRPPAPDHGGDRRKETAMEAQIGRRCIGLDVHREFAQVAIWQGGVVTQAGRFATTPEGVRAFAEELGPADEVALEATGNTWAIATLLASRAGRVVVSNPAKTRAIAEAKVKTDKVDAQILAQLLAADYLPAVWRPDPATAALRRQVLRRAHLVRQRTRLKNQVHAILHRNLVPRCPAADLFGHKGRRWLAQQDLPADELAAATALLRQLDFHAEELRLIDTDLGQAALERPDVLRLMTVPGVDATVALSIVAAVGDFTRFRTPAAAHLKVTRPAR